MQEIHRRDEMHETEVTDRTIDAQGANMVGRFVAIVATGLFTIMGLIALAKIDWSGSGFDAPAVTVAGMAFRPWIAIGTAVLGILALGAAASWDSGSKLFMGGLLVAIGIAIIVAHPTVEQVVLTDRMGWFAIIVGGVLAVVGIVAAQMWTSRRVVRDTRTVA